MHALKTVLWGAIGIRRGADAGKPVNPLHVIAAALVLVVLFVLTLVTIVRIVTG
jgi:DUF2970 family protein